MVEVARRNGRGGKKECKRWQEGMVEVARRNGRGGKEW